MKNLLYLAAFTIMMFSCKSPCEISTRKIEKIESRCPEALTKTITVRDTFIPEPYVISDTVFVTKPIDTVTLIKDNVVLKIRRIHDTLILDSLVYTCDTVFMEKEVVVEVPILKESKGWFAKLTEGIGKSILWIVGIAGLVFLILFALRRFRL